MIKTKTKHTGLVAIICRGCRGTIIYALPRSKAWCKKCKQWAFEANKI